MSISHLAKTKRSTCVSVWERMIRAAQNSGLRHLWINERELLLLP